MTPEEQAQVAVQNQRQAISALDQERREASRQQMPAYHDRETYEELFERRRDSSRFESDEQREQVLQLLKEADRLEASADYFTAAQRERDAAREQARVIIGDAEVAVSPSAQSQVVATVQAPTPIGNAAIEIERGDSYASVLLLFALVTGLLVHWVFGVAAFFYFKKKYAILQ